MKLDLIYLTLICFLLCLRDTENMFETKAYSRLSLVMEMNLLLLELNTMVMVLTLSYISDPIMLSNFLLTLVRYKTESRPLYVINLLPDTGMS